MAAVFENTGVRFRYPESWQLEREESDEGWTVYVQSPGTAFAMITLRDDATPGELAQIALDALREDYPELEADDCVDSLAGQPAIGHDVQFFSFDLTNTAWIRSFASACGTVLVLCQTSDLELEAHEPILRAICASIELEDE
ncbi:MAG: hypothetical protein AB7K24_12600 [Gemmataceae bacterium]